MNRNILLISPASDNEALWVTGNEGPEVKNNVVPLGLATIAALTPDEFHVDIWDENVHGVIGPNLYPEKEYGLAGITGYKAHMPRCLELARLFRKRFIPVVLGGPGVSATPDEYRGEFDVLFIGEAEKIWPQFLQDWKVGKHRSEYRQVESVDLRDSPQPRWDSIAKDIHKYSMGTVQTTRGCPFDCEFCDVVYLFGRRPRHKPIENVLSEIKALQRLGVRTIFFSDDEFIGDRQYAMKLLKELILLNRSFPKPVSFSTQLTLRVSQSEELLRLLADANFDVLFIGIETPNEESLKESGKRHNLVGDMIGKIHNILSHGMVVRAGIMIGFDHDGPDIFDIQYDFIQKSFIPSVAINMLKAPFGTRLWDRLRREERVVFIPPGIRKQLGHPRTYTTIIPKSMSRIDLMKGYRDLLDRTFTWESFASRVCGFVSLVGQASKQGRIFSGRLDAPRLGNLENIGAEAQEAVALILAHACKEAPFFLPKVQSLIIQHAKYRETVDRLLPQLDRQIELEATGKIRFDMDRRPILIPDGFKDAYHALFPTLHRTVLSQLAKKTEAPAALTEIFVEFLLRHGEGFTAMEPEYADRLNRICDEIIRKYNENLEDGFGDEGAQTPVISDLAVKRLGSDVLKNVRQLLLGIATSPVALGAAERLSENTFDDADNHRIPPSRGDKGGCQGSDSIQTPPYPPQGGNFQTAAEADASVAGRKGVA